MATQNRHVELAARPIGFPRESDFALVETPVPDPEAGEVQLGQEGIDHAPWAFLGLLRGENIGKMLVKVGPAPGSR